MATMMQALVKQGARVLLRNLPVPALGNPDDVLVRVVVAGLCRTDLYVARGRIPGPDPLILGHEFSGTVEDTGPAVTGLRPRDRVAVMPLIPCGNCRTCASGEEINCLRRTMLGVDRDGAFAGFVVIPARCVHRLPDTCSFQAGAYAEPIAAALAVLNAGIRPEQTGVILGRNRFSVLVQRLLKAHGFRQVILHDPPDAECCLPADSFDFVIETALSEATLREMVRVARPRGTLVLKSRQPEPVRLDVIPALAKELTLRAVQYGPFRKAVALLAEQRIDLTGLLGPIYPLEDFAAAFARAEQTEDSKLFFQLSDNHVRHR
jgi:threonine dehydrogenase-like Zn-dependent dehydrogenase